MYKSSIHTCTVEPVDYLQMQKQIIADDLGYGINAVEVEETIVDRILRHPKLLTKILE
jgi:hypothetical protein